MGTGPKTADGSGTVGNRTPEKKEVNGWSPASHTRIEVENTQKITVEGAGKRARKTPLEGNGDKGSQIVFAIIRNKEKRKRAPKRLLHERTLQMAKRELISPPDLGTRKLQQFGSIEPY